MLSGKIYSGKSTVANYLSDIYRYKQIAFADKLKLSLVEFLKTTYAINITIEDFYTAEGKQKVLPIRLPNNISNTVRGAMQWWGELMKAQLGDTFWITPVVYDLKTKSENVVISDARFTYEIEKIKENESLQFNYNIYSINIESKRAVINNHISEKHLDTYKDFDFNIDNNGSLTELYREVDKILFSIKK